jgi:hypothetical protein
VFVFGTLFFFPFNTQDGTQGVHPYCGFICTLFKGELSQVIIYAELQHCQKPVCLLCNFCKRLFTLICNIAKILFVFYAFFAKSLFASRRALLSITLLYKTRHSCVRPVSKSPKAIFPHAERVAIKNLRFLIGDGATLRIVNP